MNQAKAETLALFREAVAQDLNTLATLHHAELNDALLGELAAANFPDGIGLRLLGDDGMRAIVLMRQAMAELRAPLGACRTLVVDSENRPQRGHFLPDSPPHGCSMGQEAGEKGSAAVDLQPTIPKSDRLLAQPVLDELAADYAAIYLTYGYHASPCESVWLDQENLAMQAPMFQVREFYKLFDLVAADWRTRPDDHLVLELLFLAALFRDEHPQALPEAARFLDSHLMRWLPLFGQRVAARCATPFYAGAARLTAAYCDELRDLLADLLGEARPSAEEVEARMRPRQVAEVAPVTFFPGLAPSW